MPSSKPARTASTTWLQRQPGRQVLLRRVADLGVHDAVRRQVLHALARDPGDRLGVLHHRDGVVERLQVPHQGAGVRRLDEPLPSSPASVRGNWCPISAASSTIVAGRRPPSRWSCNNTFGASANCPAEIMPPSCQPALWIRQTSKFSGGGACHGEQMADLRTRAEWQFFAILPRADPVLATIWWVLLLVRARCRRSSRSRWARWSARCSASDALTAPLALAGYGVRPAPGARPDPPGGQREPRAGSPPGSTTSSPQLASSRPASAIWRIPT